MSLLRASEVRIVRRVEPLLVEATAPPVDLRAIADRLGAEVREMALAEDLGGILYWENDRKILVANSAQSPARRRVSLARQIGHLVLHRRVDVRADEGLRINIRAPLQSTLQTIEDLEASVFALHLLIPDRWLQEEVADPVIDFSDDVRFECVAARYGVPPSVVALRLLLLAER